MPIYPQHKLVLIVPTCKGTTQLGWLQYLYYNTLSIPDMHVLQILLLAHKLMYHKHRLPCIFRNYFKLNMNVDKHNTRGSNDLHVTAVNKNYGKRSIKHKCSIIWNKLFYLVILNITLQSKISLRN